ncbi:MAG: pyridoxal-phosphate dependent enzyme [Candidatus Micrarchaeaceae archaeon]
MRYFLKCRECRKEEDADYVSQLCEECGGMLEVVYSERPRRKPKYESMWSFKDLLPDGEYKELEAGGTKIIGNGPFLKIEIYNPTRSFKDRGSVIEVSKAKEYGYKEVVCATTGNMGYSISFYANIMQMRSTVFVMKNANKDKIDMIKSTGAKLIKSNGDFTDAQNQAKKYAKENGAFVAGDYCYRKEGQSTIAYELISQGSFEELYVPIGNGTLIAGIYKAYKMMNKYFNTSIPKIYGVEATGSAALKESIKKNVEPVHITPKTKADAIAVGYPTYWKDAIEAIKSTGGRLILVTDREMELSKLKIEREYGIIPELGGAASYAGYLKNKGAKNSCILITGGNI